MMLPELLFSLVPLCLDLVSLQILSNYPQINTCWINYFASHASFYQIFEYIDTTMTFTHSKNLLSDT